MEIRDRNAKIANSSRPSAEASSNFLVALVPQVRIRLANYTIDRVREVR